MQRRAPAGSSTSGGAPDYGQSDEQILSIDSDVISPFSKPAEAEPAADGSQASQTPADAQKPAADQQAQGAAEEIPIGTTGAKLDLRKVPQAWRELAKSDPEFAQAVADRLALTDLGYKLDDIRALKEQLPEGVKSLETMRSELAETQRIDGEYFSGDPARQAEVAAGMYRENPDAFLGMLRASSQMLAEQAPERYTAIAGEILSSTQRADGFDEFLGSVRENLDKASPEQMKEALQSVLDWGTKRGMGLSQAEQLKQREQRVALQEQSAVERQVTEERTAFAKFQNDIDTEVGKQTDTAIAELLGKSLPEQFPKAMRARIETEIRNEINKKLEGNAELREQVAGLYRTHVIPSTYNPQKHKGVIGMRLSAETQKPIIDFIAPQAKALVAATAAAILPDWTANFVAANQQKVEKAAAAAARTDVGSSSGAGAGARSRGPLKPGQVDYGKTTDEQILGL